MPESLVSASTSISIGASSTSSTELYEVPPGRTFRLLRVKVYVPTGAEGYVKLVVKKGDYNVAPTKGYVYPTSAPLTIDCDEPFSSGSKVIVEAENTDSANAHTLYVVIEGVLD